jgi:hypothetical protein
MFGGRFTSTSISSKFSSAFCVLSSLDFVWNVVPEGEITGPSGRAVWSIGLDRLDAETVGLNPA